MIEEEATRFIISRAPGRRGPRRPGAPQHQQRRQGTRFRLDQICHNTNYGKMGSKIESKHFHPSFRTTPRSRAPTESSRTRCDSSSSRRRRRRKSYRATSTMIPEAECESSPSCPTPRSLHDTFTGMLAQRNWTRLRLCVEYFTVN